MTSYKLDYSTNYSTQFLIEILQQLQKDNPNEKYIELKAHYDLKGNLESIELKSDG